MIKPRDDFYFFPFQKKYMMNEKQPVNEFARTLQKDLYNYLLSLNKVDAHLPDAPDIEEKWLPIANAYMPDAVREFNPNRSLGFLCVVRQREIL